MTVMMKMKGFATAAGFASLLLTGGATMASAFGHAPCIDLNRDYNSAVLVASADESMQRCSAEDESAALIAGAPAPVDDNRPFFFYTVQPGDVWRFITAGNRDSADFKINRAVPTLFSLIGVSVLATVAMLALPPLVLRSRLPSERGVRVFLLYFLCIGVGYILIQVALIQKFVLLLGQPTYALIVIVFAMLVASSLGSFWSKRLGAADRDSTLRWVLVSVTALVSVLSLVVTPLTNAAVGWPFAARVLLTLALIAPPAFAMGIPFPSGLTRLERRHHPSVRWAWSVNAAASVLGSGLAVFLALYLGLRETLFVGGLLYLVAIFTLNASEPSPATAAVR